MSGGAALDHSHGRNGVIPLLSKEGWRVSAGVVINAAKPHRKRCEASLFQCGALRDHLQGRFAPLITTPPALRAPLLGKEGNVARDSPRLVEATS